MPSICVKIVRDRNSIKYKRQTAHCIGLPVNFSNFRKTPFFQPALGFVPSHPSKSALSNLLLTWLMMYSKITVAYVLRVRFSHKERGFSLTMTVWVLDSLFRPSKYRLLIVSSSVKRCFKFKATIILTPYFVLVHNKSRCYAAGLPRKYNPSF